MYSREVFVELILSPLFNQVKASLRNETVSRSRLLQDSVVKLYFNIENVEMTRTNPQRLIVAVKDAVTKALLHSFLTNLCRGKAWLTLNLSD